MAPEIGGRCGHRRFFLVALAVAPVVWLAAGCDLFRPCPDCGGKGERYIECRNCRGPGAVGGDPCPTCSGSGQTSFVCTSCKGHGKQPGLARPLSTILHLVMILGIPVLIALGIVLFRVRRLRVFRSRQLRRPETIVLGLLALLTAAALGATELLLGLLFFVGGMGPEGRRVDPVEDTLLGLRFGTAGMIIVGAFILVGGVIALVGARPNVEADRTRRDGGQ